MIVIDVSAAVHQTAGIARYCVELIRALRQTSRAGEALALFTTTPARSGRRSQATNRGSVASAVKLADPLGYLPEDLRDLPAFTVTASPRRWRFNLLITRLLSHRYDDWLPRADLFHGTDHVVPPLATPTVVTVHDLTFLTHPQLHQPLNRWYLRLSVPLAIRQARAVIVPSQATAAALARQYGVPTSRIHVVPLAASARFTPTADPARQAAAMAKYGIAGPFLFSVGTIEPRKNLIALLRAYEQLPIEPTGTRPLLVIGGQIGWRAQPFLTAVDRSPLRRQILLPGRIDDADLPALLSACTAFVFPSLAEGFGLPVLEAMACGAPVVTSNVSALPEVGGDAVLYADPADPTSIANAITRLLASPRLADHLRRSGPRRAAQFSWQQTARATWAVYRQAIGESGPVSARDA